MARVNVEDSFISKAHIAKNILGEEYLVSDVIGTMVIIWHITQDIGLVRITKQQFEQFSGLIDASNYIEAYASIGVIEITATGEIDIVGNINHIERLSKLKRSAAKGGISSGITRLKNKNKSKGLTGEASASIKTKAERTQSRAEQSNTEQSNTEQSKKSAGKAASQPTPKKVSDTAWLGRLWKECHAERYGSTLPWGAKQNGQIAWLLKQSNYEDADVNIRFYFKWSEPFYVKNCHSLDLFVKQYSKIHTTRQNPQSILKHQIESTEKYETAVSNLKHSPDEETLNAQRELIKQNLEQVDELGEGSTDLLLGEQHGDRQDDV